MTVFLSESAGQAILERFKDTMEPFEREAPKPAKYRSKKCVAHVPPHASLKECRRYQHLVLLERAGEIRNLRQQVRIPICDCGKRALIMDFVYEEKPKPMNPRVPFIEESAAFRKYAGTGAWALIHEDTKGYRTETYQLKKHLLADRGIYVRET